MIKVQEFCDMKKFNALVSNWSKSTGLGAVVYGVEGENESVWFVDHVKKYHRMFSTIVNTLTEAGFTIGKMIEPLPDEELLAKYPDQADLFHKPDFLVVRAEKRV